MDLETRTVEFDIAYITKYCLFSESVFKKMNKSNRNRPELPPTEWPIHLEISSKEGPQIQELNDTLNLLIDRITESADLSAGEEILAVRSGSYLSIQTYIQH